MTLPDRIRQAIASAHLRIEQTPFAQQMAGGTISREDYAVGLRHLLYLHQGLESLFAANADPLFTALYRPQAMERADAIARDLAALQAEVLPACHDVSEQFLEQAHHWNEQSPWCLIGVLYVLEGSRMGSMVLTRSLSKAFQIEPRPGLGLDYHLDGIPTRPADWQQFKGGLLGLPLNADQAEEVCQAAIRTMDVLVELYSAMTASSAAAEKSQVG